MTTALVLMGGPDAEREVSLKSGRAIAAGLRASGRFTVEAREIDRLTAAELRALPGDVIFPALHGRWGEGGVLQRLLESDGRPFVGCGYHAARGCMDKVFTKSVAAEVGIPCAPTGVLDPFDNDLPMALPVVVKPIFEGSTIGLFICKTADDWKHAHASSAKSGKPCMVEPFVKGRELTQGVIPSRSNPSELVALPAIHITPADGLYDYEAKYTRNDTRYVVDPPLPPGVAKTIADQTLALAKRLGVRHLCRADFILDDNNRAWFLELNTMPGFTDHSLVPMAAAHVGIPMPELCALLVQAALNDGPKTR